MMADRKFVLLAAGMAASLLSSGAFAQAAAQPSSAQTEGPRVSTSSSAAPVAPSQQSAPQSRQTSPRAASPSSSPSQTQAAANGPKPGTRPGNDRLDLGTTVVTGNRELPKVLYIVPWKKADIGELPAQPFNTLLDEALTPVDRDVFRREVTYYGAVSSGGDTAVSAPPTQGGGTEK
jgi:hypothetical protein